MIWAFVISWLIMGIVSEVRLYRKLVFIDWSEWAKYLPLRLIGWPYFLGVK